MAAPGIGAGDILTACKFIYDICVKYHDAPEQFDEIAEKADATRNVISRLEIEAATGGSLVERAGPEAEKDFQGHLDGLRTDLKQLEKLVRKYAAIHDEGPGRRLLWAVWESGNLTEYRRKIGYHEQKLSFWYMNLTFGSLRRIENGQEELICALRAIPKRQERLLIDAIKKYGDYRPVTKELRSLGLDPQIIQSNLPLVTNYVTADEQTKCQMTDYVRRRSQESRVSGLNYSRDPNLFSRDSNLYSNGPLDPRFNLWDPTKPPKSGLWPNIGPEERDDDPWGDLRYSNAARPSGVRRSKSSRKPKTTKEEKDETAEYINIKPKVPQQEIKTESGPSLSGLRPGHERRKSDTPLPRRSKSPLVVIHNETTLPENVQPTHRRTRSYGDDQYDVPIIVVEQEGEQREEPRRSRSRAGSSGSQRRDSSTSSYHRERPRSSSGGSGRSVTQYRVVRALPRIDSIPVEGKD